MKKISLFILLAFLIAKSHSIMGQENYVNYMTSLDAPKIIGEGELVEDIRKLESSYFEVVIGNGIQAEITPNNQNIKIIAQANIIPEVSTTIKNNKLIIKFSKSLETYKDVKVLIPAKSITKVTAKEGTKLKIVTHNNINEFTLFLQSGAVANCNINVEKFISTTMGGATLNIEGKVSNFSDLFVKGGSYFNGDDFEAKMCDITVLGSSHCKLKVKSLLKARVENESVLLYSGNPEIAKSHTALNGKIINHANM